MKKNRHGESDAEFRALIWERDRGRSRLTGRRLIKDTDDWLLRGDVCHIKPKGAYPELRHVSGNAVLLSRNEHIQSDGRGGYLLKIEGDADAELLFRRYDRSGLLLWEKRSPCPR